MRRRVVMALVLVGRLGSLALVGCGPTRPAETGGGTPGASPVEASKPELQLYQEGADPGMPSWDIQSTPPGAEIWFDGKSTGKRTPARFAAPKAGKHVIRLVLAGHAEQTIEQDQQAGYGFSLGTILRPQGEVDREAASRIAARRPVDEAAREATRRFLGDTTLARIQFDRSPSISAVPVSVILRGDGSGQVSWFSLSRRAEHTEQIRVKASDLQPLFEALIAQGFASIVGEERLGIPDEIRYRITVTSGAGDTRQAEKWADDSHPRFDAVLLPLLRQVRAISPEIQREVEFLEGAQIRVVARPMVTFYLGRESLLATSRPGMARWRKGLFSHLSRNARTATSYFGIPADRVVELGMQVEL